ncbi:GIY-YIG nuclease family protein [Candidatus Kaiserbacteria bacterium]|nr:MAG: GIY-YIG nuclease family protein [Candidatus Kaiserbacteria bacterium]
MTVYYVYILKCNDGSLYTGITTDVERRLTEHKNGKGGHYTRAHGAAKMVYVQEYEGRGEASKREAQIKKYSRSEKLSLIKTFQKS